MRKWWWIFFIAVVSLMVWLWQKPTTPNEPANKAVEPQPVTNDISLINPFPNLQLPIDEFFDRITKKPFGIYITPENSPVQPEKFTGYHTGVDVEYGDVKNDVPVRAIADGKVVVSRTATGYGGVLVMDNRPKRLFYSLYGHLDPSSLPAVDTEVKAGDVIGKLAPAFSTQSGGERKHLHFSIIVQPTPNIAGYVATEKALAGWADPTKLLAQK